MKIGDAGLVQRPNSENPGLCPTITRLFLGLAKRKWYQSLSLEKGYKMHIFTKDLEKVPKSRRDGLRGLEAGSTSRSDPRPPTRRENSTSQPEELMTSRLLPGLSSCNTNTLALFFSAQKLGIIPLQYRKSVFYP